MCLCCILVSLSIALALSLSQHSNLSLLVCRSLPLSHISSLHCLSLGSLSPLPLSLYLPCPLLPPLLSLSISLSLSPPFPPLPIPLASSLSLSLSLSHTQISVSLTHISLSFLSSLSLCVCLSLSLSHTHYLSHFSLISLSQSVCLSLSLSLPLPLSISLSLSPSALLLSLTPSPLLCVPVELLSRYSVEADLCGSRIASYVLENSASFPMLIGDDFDDNTKIQMALFLVSHGMLGRVCSSHIQSLPITNISRYIHGTVVSLVRVHVLRQQHQDTDGALPRKSRDGGCLGGCALVPYSVVYHTVPSNHKHQ
jgi:hypothetical protein